MAVNVEHGAGLQTGAPQPLFQTRIMLFPTRNQYAVTPDGQRFVAVDSTRDEKPGFIVTLNWPALLQR